MSSLTKKLSDRSSLNRLSAVEQAYAGAPANQTNFKARWQGYDEMGRGIVKVDGKEYTAEVLGSFSVPLNTTTILRVGKNIKNIAW